MKEEKNCWGEKGEEGMRKKNKAKRPVDELCKEREEKGRVTHLSISALHLLSQTGWRRKWREMEPKQ